MFCLLELSFAWGPFEIGANEDVPLEARVDFMQATHEGDYEAALELHEEYGLGGKKMEQATPELFELVSSMFQAQLSGDWFSAVGFQDRMMEHIRTHAKEMHRPIPKCEEGADHGMHKQRRAPEGAAECQEAIEANEDALAIRGQIHEAMQSQDLELAKELHQQLQKILPEECKGMQQPRGMRGHMENFSNTE